MGQGRSQHTPASRMGQGRSRQIRAGRRRGRLAVALAAAVAAALWPAVTSASKPVKVKTGYYATLVGVSSADVEFHVRAHGASIPDLELVCEPVEPAILEGTGEGKIGVVAPKLTIHAGRFSYNGTAPVKGAFASGKQVGTSTLKIEAHHVSGPVRHYTYEGRHLQETTAWIGTVSSPACESVGGGGHLKLFGPVPGE